ncbi:hypothetical protein ElyMa_000202300 [Elysia marginata]|uniref:Uncharacterized protein n=1 Tax=Elysia marginata TaxID=1093978 RepID=A0AAV4EX81_9GAST|nr:hypothetical protein ElyMa_000202300 [Elysia marginata]
MQGGPHDGNGAFKRTGRPPSPGPIHSVPRQGPYYQGPGPSHSAMYMFRDHQFSHHQVLELATREAFKLTYGDVIVACAFHSFATADLLLTQAMDPFHKKELIGAWVTLVNKAFSRKQTNESMSGL